ncbi:MAG: MOSC domain-containing protein, partial [Candidatus Puniceispirillaceae bacterium]
SDQSTALISIASNASLDAFAEATNTKSDSRRFRINIIIDGDTPFAEAALIGTTLRCGDALLLVKETVGRCAAINVDPATAKRNPVDYVRFMKARFGHSNLGIFAEVINGGIIRVGDRLQPA